MSIQEKASITRRYTFAASHRLHSDQLSAEENRQLFGKCNNPNGHGHNYVLFVTIQGLIDPKKGTVADIGFIDEIVRNTVIARFNHQDLNLDPGFSALTTTGENLVRFIWDLLVTRMPADGLKKVGLVETRDNYFEYAA